MISFLPLELWTATADLTAICNYCAPRAGRLQLKQETCLSIAQFAFSLFKMKNMFLVISSAGPNRHCSKSTREQPFWDEHATFIDQLVSDGFILMGGPLVDEGGALLI